MTEIIYVDFKLKKLIKVDYSYEKEYEEIKERFNNENTQDLVNFRIETKIDNTNKIK